MFVFETSSSKTEVFPFIMLISMHVDDHHTPQFKKPSKELR